MKPESITIKNLESAFAGESMAHIKYRYFAKIARAQGDEATAKVFEDTADQEVQHAFGHLDLLYPKDKITKQDVADYYAAVAQPVHAKAVGRWRNYADYLEPVLPILEPLVKAFGYRPS